MSNLLVVFGASGQQGGSVIRHILRDSTLSTQFKVRAVTRDPGQPSCQRLESEGVEVVRADFDHADTIRDAVRGAHTIFLMVPTLFDVDGPERQMKQGKTVVDAAVAAGAQFLIATSQVNTSQLSAGQCPVVFWDTLAELERYIRDAPIKHAFVAPASFMQNLLRSTAPLPAGDGTHYIAGVQHGDRPIPWIDVEADLGKFVGGILAAPDMFHGRFIAAASELLSYKQVAEKISKASKITVIYTKMPEEHFRVYLPATMSTAWINLQMFVQDYGYYGPRTDALVEECRSMARDDLASLDQFLQKHPPDLD